MNTIGTFPFGQPIHRVEQEDRQPKRVFVLGVYASAVHARWRDSDGHVRINAVGVASEPEIFWRGDSVEDLLDGIDIPDVAGRLEPASESLNGPSGRTLDGSFLEPLGLSRSDTWLCDLVPHSCMNDGQKAALERDYLPSMAELGLPTPQWPQVPREIATPHRQSEIGAEIATSNAEVLITLGDQPLKWFTARHGGHRRLAAYGETPELYGRLHPIHINGREVQLLPLVHPRQAGRLGSHSQHWAELHEAWTRQLGGAGLDGLRGGP